MPVRGADGVEMVICLGDGLAVVTIGADGRPIDDSPPKPAPCPWDHGAQPAVIAAGLGAEALPAILRPAGFAAPLDAMDVPAHVRRVSNRGPPATI